MTLRLDPKDHAWLAAPETRAVFDALDAARPGAARIVGGAVRNAVMGRPVDDIDIATQLDPAAVQSAAEAAGIKCVATGLAHGTVTLVVNGAPFEVTSLRRDVTTDGRNATVAFTEDWKEDSARRDFRLNALYVDRDGVVFDPQGGLGDAKSGKIVFIGDASARIQEDYLRILRFFRFTAWYGAGELDADALAACTANAPGMRRLSAERVWKELKKLLGARDPAPALQAMMETGVLEQTLPEAMALDLIKALVALEGQEGWAPDAMLRLAALIPRMARVADRVRSRMKLSNAEGDRLSEWASRTYNPRLLLEKSDAEVALTLYPLHIGALVDRARLAWAIDAAQGEAQGAAWRVLIDQITGYERPVFPLTGKDLVAAGVPKGPKVGAALKALEQLWARGGFKTSRDDLLQALDMMAR